MQSIYHSLASEKAQTAPFNFQPKAGAKVPDSPTMYPLPSTVTNEIAATKGFEYAKLASNEVVLIGPKDRHEHGCLLRNTDCAHARKAVIAAYAISICRFLPIADSVPVIADSL